MCAEYQPDKFSRSDWNIVRGNWQINRHPFKIKNLRLKLWYPHINNIEILQKFKINQSNKTIFELEVNRYWVYLQHIFVFDCPFFS